MAEQCVKGNPLLIRNRFTGIDQKSPEEIKALLSTNAMKNWSDAEWATYTDNPEKTKTLEHYHKFILESLGNSDIKAPKGRYFKILDEHTIAIYKKRHSKELKLIDLENSTRTWELSKWKNMAAVKQDKARFDQLKIFENPDHKWSMAFIEIEGYILEINTNYESIKIHKLHNNSIADIMSKSRWLNRWKSKLKELETVALKEKAKADEAEKKRLAIEKRKKEREAAIAKQLERERLLEAELIKIKGKFTKLANLRSDKLKDEEFLPSTILSKKDIPFKEEIYTIANNYGLIFKLVRLESNKALFTINGIPTNIILYQKEDAFILTAEDQMAVAFNYQYIPKGEKYLGQVHSLILIMPIHSMKRMGFMYSRKYMT